MPLLPLWNGAILCTINTTGNGNAITGSNASVENNIYNSVSRLNAADFIISIYTNINLY